MKARAYQRYNYTVNLFDYVDQTQSDGSVLRTHSIAERDRKININTDNTNRLIITCATPIDLEWGLRTLKDRAGVEIGYGYMWYIKSIEPVINALGYVEGYRMKTGPQTPYLNVSA